MPVRGDIVRLNGACSNPVTQGVDASLSPHPCLSLRCVALCRFETNRAMTRCSCCNAADFRLLTSQEAKEQVPKHVFEVSVSFRWCPKAAPITGIT